MDLQLAAQALQRDGSERAADLVRRIAAKLAALLPPDPITDRMRAFGWVPASDRGHLP